MKLIFHHIGIAVDSIEESSSNYKRLFGDESCSEIFHISTQNVNVCFVNMGNGQFMELVEPANDESSVHRMRKKGINYYHTAFITENIEHTVAEMEELHYKKFEYFNSEAFKGKRCIFLYTPDAHLIELIEA